MMAFVWNFSPNQYVNPLQADIICKVKDYYLASS